MENKTLLKRPSNIEIDIGVGDVIELPHQEDRPTVYAVITRLGSSGVHYNPTATTTTECVDLGISTQTTHQIAPIEIDVRYSISDNNDDAIDDEKRGLEEEGKACINNLSFTSLEGFIQKRREPRQTFCTGQAIIFYWPDINSWLQGVIKKIEDDCDCALIQVDHSLQKKSFALTSTEPDTLNMLYSLFGKVFNISLMQNYAKHTTLANTNNEILDVYAQEARMMMMHHSIAASSSSVNSSFFLTHNRSKRRSITSKNNTTMLTMKMEEEGANDPKDEEHAKMDIILKSEQEMDENNDAYDEVIITKKEVEAEIQKQEEGVPATTTTTCSDTEEEDDDYDII